MTFTEAVRTCFRKYVTFSGRASRSEYWWFVLFVLLGNAVLSAVDAAIFGPNVTTETVSNAAGDTRTITRTGNGPLVSIFGLATLLPGLAAGWRRMHDTGRSGLYLLYPLIVMVGIGTFAAFTGAVDGLLPGAEGEITPFQGLAGLVLVLASIVFLISPLLVLWWLTRPSQPGSNEYGPNPHEVTS